MELDRDWQIRLAAIARLEELRTSRGGVVTSDDLDEGFVFENTKIKFRNAQRGIWRPVQLQSPGAALSIVTAPRIVGRKPAYDDEVASEDGSFGYRYQGTDPEAWDNVAVRTAFTLRRPLLYFYGLSKGVYEAMYPAYVIADDPPTLTFRIQIDVSVRAFDPLKHSLSVDAPRREYETRAVKKRLHQDRFREIVLGAYLRRCCMCNLGHERLLDAAHIIPDRDVRGEPLVSNGLALCKIHHTAYDENILGISPDLKIHVREDVLEEVDGPMLEHGLKRMEKRKIAVPRPLEMKPNHDFLAERFDLFLGQ